MITPPQDSSKKPADKPARKKKSKFGSILNILLLIGIIAVGYMFYTTEQKRMKAEEELQNTTNQLEELRQSAQNTGQQVANEVLTKLRNHIDIPAEPQPTVATISDIDRLRETNQFYSKAKNGDHLIITETRAILYDAERDIVIDVVPVRINPAATPDPNATQVPAADTATESATPSPAISPAS